MVEVETGGKGRNGWLEGRNTRLGAKRVAGGRITWLGVKMCGWGSTEGRNVWLEVETVAVGRKRGCVGRKPRLGVEIRGWRVVSRG